MPKLSKAGQPKIFFVFLKKMVLFQEMKIKTDILMKACITVFLTAKVRITNSEEKRLNDCIL